MKNINALKMIAVMMVIVASPVIAQEWDGTGPCFCNAGCYNSRTCERGYEVSPSECGVSATAGSVCADGYYCTSPTNYYGICEPCGDDDEEYWINEQDTEGSVAACCFDSSAGCAWIDSGNQIHCNVKDAAGNGGFEGGSGDEGTCVDGIDNDCDGLTDCYDTDCHIGAQCKMSVCTAGQCDEVYGPGTDQCSLHTDCQHYSCVSSVCTLINDDSPDIADDCTYDGECSAVYAWELVAEGTNLITYETGPECVNIPDEDADTCIRITRGNDGTVCGDNNDRVCYAYLTQDVGMLPQGKYELSAWVKGNDAKIGWHYQGQPYAYVSSTQADWKRISITIGADGAREVIIILEPDKQSVGDFFYDDIQLIRVNSGTDIPAFVPKQGAFLAPPGQASFSEDQYYPSGCCADTHCWTGFECKEGILAKDQSSSTQIPFCVKGTDDKASWQMSYKALDSDGDVGYCADEDFCYHKDTSEEKCYEDGATQGGFLCHQGSWMSRTRLLAGYMITLAEDNEITDYRLL
ncbi:MAG: hypothetical protein KJ709_01545, partial [Nanoarchaeota archaeon]|nr:hypothetical protein [Nanoarchaeota archaeon]